LLPDGEGKPVRPEWIKLFDASHDLTGLSRHSADTSVLGEAVRDVCAGTNAQNNREPQLDFYGMAANQIALAQKS
jgi:hypothetical protein